jgi:hypothetical protein
MAATSSGHLRHLDALGDQPADEAADSQRRQCQIDAAGDEQRGGDRDDHPGDAEAGCRVVPRADWRDPSGRG